MSNTFLTGKEFNAMYKDKLFYKFTYDNDTHYGMTYTDGLNEDINEFSTSDNKTGIYFFETRRAFKHYNKKYGYIRKVTIPDDAKIGVRETSFRTNKIIFSPKEKFGSDLALLDTFFTTRVESIEINEVFYNKLLSENPNLNKFDLLNIFSKHNNKFRTEVVAEKSECLKRIEENPFLVNFIKNADTECYKLAFSLNGLVLKDCTEDIEKLRKIITNKGFFSADLTNKMLEELSTLETIAVTQNFEALKYITNPTDEQCTIAVTHDFRALRYITNPTDEQLTIAFSQSSKSIDFIKNKLSADITLYVLGLYPHLIAENSKIFNNFTSMINESNAINFVKYFKYMPPKYQTEEICKLALQDDISNCKYLDNKFIHLVKLA